jgi:hypothetical protein
MLPSLDAEPHHRVRRFLVAWRNTTRPQISPVAVLQNDSHGFRFWYLPSAAGVRDFRPFLGFPDLARVYESKHLWPFFSVRVMDARRPDYAAYLKTLGLVPGASPLDILSRSGGERKGDAVQVIEEPSVGNDGPSECIFLVRGARYAAQEYGSEARSATLEVGEPLSLHKDGDNPVNPEALIIATVEALPVGWVPDMLIPYVDTIRNSGGWTLTVLRNNGHAVPWHMRLLVKLEGEVPEGYQAFSSAGVAEPLSAAQNLG